MTKFAGTGWWVWALLSAVFAALTAAFAKIGLAKVDSGMATLSPQTRLFLVLALR